MSVIDFGQYQQARQAGRWPAPTGASTEMLVVMGEVETPADIDRWRTFYRLVQHRARRHRHRILESPMGISVKVWGYGRDEVLAEVEVLAAGFGAIEIREVV